MPTTYDDEGEFRIGFVISEITRSRGFRGRLILYVVNTTDLLPETPRPQRKTYYSFPSPFNVWNEGPIHLCPLRSGTLTHTQFHFYHLARACQDRRGAAGCSKGPTCSERPTRWGPPWHLPVTEEFTWWCWRLLAIRSWNTTRAQCLLCWQTCRQLNPCLSEVSGKHGLIEQTRTQTLFPTANDSTTKTVIMNQTSSSSPLFGWKRALSDNDFIDNWC